MSRDIYCPSVGTDRQAAQSYHVHRPLSNGVSTSKVERPCLRECTKLQMSWKVRTCWVADPSGVEVAFVLLCFVLQKCSMGPELMDKLVDHAV